MKRLIATILSVLLNAYYRHCAKGGRRDLAGFLSRQSNEVTPDFRWLGRAFEKLDGWEVEYQQRMLEGGLGAKVSFAFHLLTEVRLLARCRICFVEGYNPALSLLRLKSEELGQGTPNTSAPTEPLVFQLWHAGGMFKKFGYQTVGTPQGRSVEDARLFRMHANYSWIVCSGESARPVFAEAFGYPCTRAVALGRPSNDELFDADAVRAATERVRAAYPHVGEGGKPVVVLAPTLRRGAEPRPFDELRAVFEQSGLASCCELVWSDHPVLDRGRGVSTTDLLHVASLVVTDYSSVVYDAALLKVPFAFYVPDIESYRASPGLNTDPELASPQISFRDAGELASFIEDVLAGGGEYPAADARAFIGDSLSASGPGATERIVSFSLKQAEGR